jgi:hypothetical protein
MFRRLHFLLPNQQLAKAVVEELNSLGINNQQIHAYAEHNFPVGELPAVTKNQAHDKTLQVENLLWKGNLILFFVLLAVGLVSLVVANYTLALISATLMLLSFAVGNFFAQHIPHVHLYQFADALSHNELMLMVDVDDEKLEMVEKNIHRHHPAVVEGGSCWTVKGMNI